MPGLGGRYFTDAMCHHLCVKKGWIKKRLDYYYYYYICRTKKWDRSKIPTIITKQSRDKNNLIGSWRASSNPNAVKQIIFIRQTVIDSISKIKSSAAEFEKPNVLNKCETGLDQDFDTQMCLRGHTQDYQWRVQRNSRDLNYLKWNIYVSVHVADGNNSAKAYDFS